MQREISAYTNLKPDGKASWYESQVGPKSLITFQSDPHKLPGRGFYEISGLAWAGRGAISRVEVSTDGGRTWKDASLQQPVFRKAWTRFRHGWNWDGAETVIMSRCTDEYGDIQQTYMELAKMWGLDQKSYDEKAPAVPATEMAEWLTNVGAVLNNQIQPWRVSQDGSVQDELFSALLHDKI